MEDSRKTFSAIFFLQNLHDRVAISPTQPQELHVDLGGNEGKYLLSIAVHEWRRVYLQCRGERYQETLFDFLNNRTTLQQKYDYTPSVVSRWMCLCMNVNDFPHFKDLVAKAIAQFDNDKSFGLGMTLSTALGMRLV